MCFDRSFLLHLAIRAGCRPFQSQRAFQRLRARGGMLCSEITAIFSPPVAAVVAKGRLEDIPEDWPAPMLLCFANDAAMATYSFRKYPKVLAHSHPRSAPKASLDT